jgi:ATP-dependent DNA helicase RecG
MRPNLLNPLFAEVEVLKGVGPQLAKPLKRLGLDRIVDLAFHVPVTWIDRKAVERLDEADVGRVITIQLTAREYRQSGGPRAPLRIHAEDGGGDYVTLTYFRNPGWAKQQLPLGTSGSYRASSTVTGRSCRWSIRIMCWTPPRANQLPEREPVYALAEGLTNKRMGDFAAQALGRLPALGEWDRAEPEGEARLARLERGACLRHADPPTQWRASGWPMTRCSPTSWR